MRPPHPTSAWHDQDHISKENIMGIELGSLEGVVGEDGTFDILAGFIGTIDKFVKAAGYFTGGDLQEAIAGGFMK